MTPAIILSIVLGYFLLLLAIAFYTVQWTNSSNVVIGNSYSLINVGAGSYTFQVTDNAGCVVDTTITLVSSGSGNPTTITSDKDSICANDSAHICAPPDFISYLWSNGMTTQCIYTNLAGNYYLTVTENGGCTATSNHLSLTVLPLPPVQISVSGDTLTSCNAVSYQWYFNNTLINGAINQVYVATQSGSYFVAVTDTNGCVAHSNVINITVNGIADLSTENAFEIYPNPNAGGIWQLKVDARLINSELQIFDDKGASIFFSKVRNALFAIEPDLPKGVYVIKIGVAVRKLIKL